MPPININFLRKLQEDYTKYPVFIETGTYNGDTIYGVESYFEKLYTVELSEKYYIQTKAQYSGDKIMFVLGDSSLVFEYLLDDIDLNAIFFLDGHWSSDDTARGDKDCPLIEEIACINNLFKNRAIIIIDDYRLFGKGPHTGNNEDWSTISVEKIIAILGKRIYKSYFLDSEHAEKDRLILHITSI